MRGDEIFNTRSNEHVVNRHPEVVNEQREGPSVLMS
jgi:hypothetical protein